MISLGWRSVSCTRMATLSRKTPSGANICGISGLVPVGCVPRFRKRRGQLGSLSLADVGVGEEVRAQWQGFGYKGKLYHGIIEAINDDGSFHVRFDDGDVDPACPAKYITRENGAAVPRVQGGCFTLCKIARCTVQCKLCELITVHACQRSVLRAVPQKSAKAARSTRAWHKATCVLGAMMGLSHRGLLRRTATRRAMRSA